MLTHYSTCDHHVEHRYGLLHFDIGTNITFSLKLDHLHSPCRRNSLVFFALHAGEYSFVDQRDGIAETPFGILL